MFSSNIHETHQPIIEHILTELHYEQSFLFTSTLLRRVSTPDDDADMREGSSMLESNG